MSGSPSFPGEHSLRVDDVIITDELDRRPSRSPDHAAENRALRDLTDKMAREPGAMLQSLAAAAMTLTRSGSAGISLLEPGGERGTFRWVALSGVFARHQGSSFPPDASPCSEVLARNAVLLLREPGRVYPLCFEIGADVHEVLLAPFHVCGKPSGTIWAIKHDRKNRFEREDVRLFDGLVRFAAAAHGMVRALQGAWAASARSEKELAARLADAELLQKLSTSLIPEQEPEALYEQSLTAAMTLMRADAASLQILTPEADQLVLLASRNLHPQSVAHWQIVDAGNASPCGQSLQAHARVVVEDAEADAAFAGTQDLEEFRRSGIRAAQSTPLVARSGRPVGLISTHWRQPRRLDEADIRLLDVLARQLADLFERAATEAALRQSEERQAMLLRLSDAVRTTSDPAVIEQTAIRMLGEHLGLARAYYFSVERDTHGWGHVVTSAYQRAPDQPSIVGRHSLQHFGAWMFEGFGRGEAVAVSDVSGIAALTSEEVASYRVLGVAAFINVPLLKHGEYDAGIGAHNAVPRAWAPAEIALIREVGERTWMAVERTRAEVALRESEARFRALATAGSYLIYRMSTDWSQMYQLDGRDFLADTGEPITNWTERYIPQDDLPRVSAAIAAAIRDTAPFELEHRVRRADGTVGWVLSRAVPILDKDGRVAEWFGAGSDITARKDAEAKARRSEELRRIALESGGMGAWRWNLRQGLIWGDARLLTLWGHPPSDAPHPLALFTGRMSPDGAADMEAIVSRAIEAGEGFEGQLEIASGPTAGRWAFWRGRADGQEPWILHGVSFDVTDQRRAVAALRESEERLRQFGDASLDVLWIRDAETLQWTYLTPAFEAIYGLSREEALAGDNYRVWQDLIVPEDRAQAMASINRVSAGERATFEYRIRRPADGQLRWLRDTDFPMRDEAGRVMRIGGVGHDITPLKAIQAAMAESETRLRTLMEGIPQLVWRSCDKGLWTWASPQWMAFTGQTQEESLGLGWLATVHSDDQAAVMRAWDETQPQSMLDLECRVRRASDGAWLWHRTRSVPVQEAPGPDGAEGRITEWLGTTTDIDDLKLLQGQQQVLVAELQHRTRNLLAVVRNVARRSIGSSPGRDEYDARLAALGRVQGFLSRSPHYSVPLADVVEAELQATGDGTSDKVEVGGPPVELPGESVQAVALALHELATNAVKYGAIAQPSGGLSVVWRIETGDDDANRLVIDWRESGVTMPDEPLARRGYGTELITRALPYQLRAETELEFTPDGVRCRIALPSSSFSKRTNGKRT